MDTLTAQLNTSEELGSISIEDTTGKIFPGANPVLATPGAFLGGVAVSSATVAAFEQGKG